MNKLKNREESWRLWVPSTNWILCRWI